MTRLPSGLSLPVKRPPSSPLSSRALIVRVSPDDIILYANQAMADYLSLSREVIQGTPLEVFRERIRGELATCFARPEGGRTHHRLLADGEGRIFEVKTYTENGVMDLILDEMPLARGTGRAGSPQDTTESDEERSARHPERRFLSIVTTRFHGLTKLTEKTAPSEMRVMMSSLLEELTEAARQNTCFISERRSDGLVAVAGAPLYHANHGIRALKCANESLARIAALRSDMYRYGKEFPLCSAGVASAEALIGSMGASDAPQYTIIGAGPELSQRLANLARPGEVLITGITLQQILQHLPEGWEAIRAESEEEPDLTDLEWNADRLQPLPEELKCVVYLVGPGVSTNMELVELYLEYLFCLELVEGESIAILRAVRPEMVGSSLELTDDHILSSQPAQVLGKYKLVELIGQGGMGKVWRGLDRFGNAVAIKVLATGEGASESQIKRFRREAEIMAKLPHRNICRVYEMNEFEGIHYIAMEYVAGLTLSELLYEKLRDQPTGEKTDLQTLIESIRSEKLSRSRHAETAPETDEAAAVRPKESRILPLEQVLTIFTKVCDAVQFAHEHGVLHRDLKPGNILLRQDGEPLVADFGLAKIDSAEAGFSLSLTGQVVGTLENMAPEQAESSKTVDERADVYALGTILYQMLTGRRHFEATGNIVSDAQSLKNHEPMRPRQISRQIDVDLELIVLKSLKNEPGERYRSVAALKADLEHYRRGEVISAKPVSVAELFTKLIQRNKAISATVFASLLMLIGLALVALTQWHNAVQHAARAETAALLAQEKQREAENALIQAQEAMSLANKREVEAAEARTAVQAAQSEKQVAVTETERAKQAQQVALEEARRKAEELDTLRKETETAALSASLPVTEDPQPEIADEPETKVQNRHLSRELFQRAMMNYNFQFMPFELRNYSRNPEVPLRRVSQLLSEVSESLIQDRSFAPAWMLKGRLHLACLELNAAKEAFAQASQLPPPHEHKGTTPSTMLEMVEAIQQGGATSSQVIEALRNSGDAQNQIAAGILQFFTNEFNSNRETNKKSPFGRSPTQGEIVLHLVTSLPQDAQSPQITLQEEEGKYLVRIVDAGELKDLSMLRELPVKSLQIRGAKQIDWETIAQLQPEVLDLSHSNVGGIPLNSFRWVSKLKQLHLADTPIERLDFLASASQLEVLNIAHSHVADLAPLQAFSRVLLRLRQLDISGLSPTPLANLNGLPLELVVLSPLLIDPSQLQTLRRHATLRRIRTSDDPEDQSAQAFWNKLDAGGYSGGTISQE